MIQLGDTVKDKISGFKGIAVGRQEWLTGCVRYVVQQKVDKDGKIPEAFAIDEPCLVVLKKAKAVKPMKPDEPGGPPSRPTRNLY